MTIKGTSNYNNISEGNLVSITGDGGNAWNFYGNSYKKLAPKWYLYEYYHNNPDNLSEEDIIDWYIKEFYETRLKELNAYELLETLDKKFGDNIILLCHEEVRNRLSKLSFCHRRLVADWLYLETGIIIPEIKMVNNELIEVESYDLKDKIRKLKK